MVGSRDLGSIRPGEVAANLLQQKALFHLLSKSKTKLWHSTEYTVSIDDQIYKFTLSKAILWRKCTSNNKEFRYEVFEESSKLDGGNFGAIFNVEATLKLEPNETILVKNTPRVIKQFFIDPKSTYHQVNAGARESRLTQKIADRGAKKVVYIYENNTIRCFMVMRKLPGTSLKKLLDNEFIMRFSKITLEQRIDISLALLRKLQTQIHDNGIIHRDMKPGNFMLDLQTKSYFVIDLGLSKEDGEKISELCGTPLYMAKEQWQGTATDQSTDSYAVGRLLAELWGMEFKLAFVTRKTFSKQSPDAQLKEVSDTAADDIEYDLDSLMSIPDLNKDTKRVISLIIQNMTKVKKASRLSSQMALYQFEKIKTSLRINQHKIKEATLLQDIHQARQKAVKAREELRELRANHHKRPVTPDFIQAIIHKHLFLLLDHPVVIEQFVDTLDIAAFVDAKDKQSIQNKMVEVCEKYNNYSKNKDFLQYAVKSFKLFESEASSTPYLQLASKISEDMLATLERKEKKSNQDLDGYCGLTQKFSTLFKPSRATAENVITLLFDHSTCIREDDLSLLKLRIRHAITDYMSTTYTDKNIKKQDRAASKQRIADMYDLLKIADEHEGDIKSLISKLSVRTREIKHTSYDLLNHRFFRLFTSSQLQKSMQETIDEAVIASPKGVAI